jgi:outer membrane immunogenic protein
MKKIALGISIVAFSAVSASAADMAVKAPPMAPPAPVYDWNGWYVGGNVGGGIAGDPSSELAVSGPAFPGLAVGTPLYGGTKTFDVSSKGALGGGQVGYNWQSSANFVLGVEADIQASNISGSAHCIVTCGSGINTVPGNALLGFFPVVFSSDNVTHTIDWFGTVRGRVGYAAGPALFYVTGGLAYGEVERSGNVAGITTSVFAPGTAFNNFAGGYNASSTKTGWTVGGGVEGKIWTNWSVKAEYLYVDLGSTTDSFNTVYGPGGFPATGIAATRTDTAIYRDNIFRVGLNYHFNPAGVVAKY